MRRLLAPALVLLFLASSATGAQAQGWGLTRERPRPRAGHGARPHTPRVRDVGARRQLLIRRYRAILSARPSEEMAFSRLLSLLRERDGGLDRFAQELEQELAGATADYSLLMLSARLAEQQDDAARARLRYQAASSLRPERPEPT
ncbi:MAG: hypothetical protein GXP55_14745, partial [Deltaproteobacteria bacterium]|nr:hypothetical protein [Deltaproteobacteria bacterium]